MKLRILLFECGEVDVTVTALQYARMFTFTAAT